jgi:hypothetical protein
MTDIVEMTQAAFAQRRGVTPKAIEKAIKAGRIPPAAVRRDGRAVLIDVAAAELALGQPSLRVNTPPDDAAASAADSASPSSSPSVPKETPALTAARTEQAQIETRIKSLELDRRLGKLLEADDVARAMARCAEALIHDVDQIAARADDVVTAYTRNGVAGVRALLKQISRDTRETIANNMRLLEAEDRADTGDDGEIIAAGPARAAAGAEGVPL